MKHGAARRGQRTTEYRAWKAMMERCYRVNNPKYPRYGGRGIRVCRRWGDGFGFSNFLADMGPRPPGLTLDRKNNNGNYTPKNCHWATSIQQARNHSLNRIVQFGGKRMPLAAACEKAGLRYGLVKRRLQIGWTPAKALHTPLMKRFGK